MKNSFFWNIFLPSPLLLEKPGYSFLLTCIVLLKQDRAAVISEIQGAEVCCSHQQERGMEILLSLSFSSRALKQFSSGGFQNPPQQPSGEHTVVCLEDMWMQLCHEMHFKVPAVLCFTKQWQKGVSCLWMKVESSPNYLVCHHQIIWVSTVSHLILFWIQVKWQGIPTPLLQSQSLFGESLFLLFSLSHLANLLLLRDLRKAKAKWYEYD